MNVETLPFGPTAEPKPTPDLGEPIETDLTQARSIRPPLFSGWKKGGRSQVIEERPPQWFQKSHPRVVTTSDRVAFPLCRVALGMCEVERDA